MTDPTPEEITSPVRFAAQMEGAAHHQGHALDAAYLNGVSEGLLLAQHFMLDRFQFGARWAQFLVDQQVRAMGSGTPRAETGHAVVASGSRFRLSAKAASSQVLSLAR